MHDRATHLLAKNPDMGKSEAFAIATQQMHAAGKTPKGYGTAQGKREAKEKYDEPKKNYDKTANPGGLESSKLAENPNVELAGLGLLAVPSLDHLQAALRARLKGDKSEKGVDKRKLLNLSHTGEHAFEAGGLGVLAAPYLAKKFAFAKIALGLGGLGALAGGAGGALIGAATAEKGHRLRGATIGGLGGAAMGGAAGLGVKALSNRAASALPQAATQQASALAKIPVATEAAAPALAKARPELSLSLPTSARARYAPDVAHPSAVGVAKTHPELSLPPPGAVGGRYTPSSLAPSSSPASGQAWRQQPAVKDALEAANSNKNLTLAGGARVSEGYHADVPAHLRGALENTDLVRAGVPPQIAAALASASRQKGEHYLASIARHAAGGSAGAATGFRAGARDAATAMGKMSSALLDKLAFADCRAELEKLADALNIGQWWEATGGPFLAKGGSLEEFQRMMDKAGIPSKVQAKFMNAAETRYAHVRENVARTARRASQAVTATSPWAGALQGTGFGAALGSALYAVVGAQTADPDKGPSRTTAQISAAASGALPSAAAGYAVAGLFNARPQTQAAAAGIGALVGGMVSHLAFKGKEEAIGAAVGRALRSNNLDRAARRLEREAEKSVAGLSREQLLGAVLRGVAGGIGDITRSPLGNLGSSLGARLLGNTLGSISQRYLNVKAHTDFQEKRDAQKVAFVQQGVEVEGAANAALGRPHEQEKSAFTESEYSGGTGPGPLQNYASYIPPFRMPKPKLKTASPPSEGFKVAGMRDELVKLNGLHSPESQLSQSQHVGAPRVTAPPGPSIQQIAKPVGFGRPLPGANKSIGAK